MTDRWATFDCYGTLIDWFGGVRSQLVRLWPGADADALLATYLRAEARLQEGRGTPYREVMAEALEAVGQEQGATVPVDERDALAASLPTWSVFPEVPAALRELRTRGWKLAILSNTDPDLLDASIHAIDVPVDERIVASEIGSYKPAFGHWETFFRRT